MLSYNNREEARRYSKVLIEESLAEEEITEEVIKEYTDLREVELNTIDDIKYLKKHGSLNITSNRQIHSVLMNIPDNLLENIVCELIEQLRATH